MPRARDRFARCEQALRWLVSEYPPGRRIRLEWVDVFHGEPSVVGQTFREGGEIVIELRRLRCRSCLLETLMHEYSHAASWPVASAELTAPDHPPAFWALFGEISDRWHHDGGSEESQEFDAE